MHSLQDGMWIFLKKQKYFVSTLLNGIEQQRAILIICSDRKLRLHLVEVIQHIDPAPVPEGVRRHLQREAPVRLPAGVVGAG